MPRDPVTGRRVSRAKNARTQRFFSLRKSGYRGPIDQDGYPCRTTGKGKNTRFVRDKRFVASRRKGGRR